MSMATCAAEDKNMFKLNTNAFDFGSLLASYVLIRCATKCMLRRVSQ